MICVTAINIFIYSTFSMINYQDNQAVKMLFGPMYKLYSTLPKNEWQAC